MPSMKRHHYRAEYVDNSFEVESVDHIEGDVYSMNFSYNWFAGSGCKDDVGGDIDFDCTRFTYRNGTIVFEYEEPEERYPDDEF